MKLVVPSRVQLLWQSSLFQTAVCQVGARIFTLPKSYDVLFHMLCESPDWESSIHNSEWVGEISVQISRTPPPFFGNVTMAVTLLCSTGQVRHYPHSYRLDHSNDNPLNILDACFRLFTAMPWMSTKYLIILHSFELNFVSISHLMPWSAKSHKIVKSNFTSS